MKISKRIAATSAAVLLGTLVLGGGVANAADGGGHGHGGGKASPQKTVEAAPGTDHVAAKKVEPASKDNPYSQTVEAKPGTPHTGAGVLAEKRK
ncbi:hypothetical protein ACFXDJ_03265 [Streptomyces sp. NPDC059443]|uniref:hypothetical protein n=1 Tax=unclassified Streptomyces TaxID=2593676 RepID=UPI0036B77BB9